MRRGSAVSRLAGIRALTAAGFQAINSISKKPFTLAFPKAEQSSTTAPFQKPPWLHTLNPSKKPALFCSLQNLFIEVKAVNCIPLTKDLAPLETEANSYLWPHFSSTSGHLVDHIAALPNSNTSWVTSAFWRVETEKILPQLCWRSCFKRGWSAENSNVLIEFQEINLLKTWLFSWKKYYYFWIPFSHA